MADSDSAAEFQETLNKAGAVARALAMMFRKFRDVPVELDVKKRILRGLEQPPPPR